MNEHSALARASELLLKHMERLDKMAENVCNGVTVTHDDQHVLSMISQSMEVIHKELREGNVTAFVPQPLQNFFSHRDGAYDTVADTLAEWCILANKGGLSGSDAPPLLKGAEAVLDLLGIPCSVRYDAKCDEYTSVSVGGITRQV